MLTAAVVTAAMQCCCMQKAAELLREGNAKYTAKDLMGALKLYEDVLNQVGYAARSACRTAVAGCCLQDDAGRTLQRNRTAWKQSVLLSFMVHDCS